LISFDDARAAWTAATGQPTQPWGWQNDAVYVVVLEHDALLLGEPARLVDKATGELHTASGLRWREPAPNLRPIGDVPD